MRAASDPIPASDVLPLVSVIIPAYNSERYIADAIDSVLQQDYPALEIWVVDDGSVDNTQTIVRGYGDKVQLASQKNKGSAAARNLGILNAHGKYIAFLDADDVWRKNKISFQVDALRSSGYRMAYSSFIRWHPDAHGRYAAPDTLFGDPHHPDTFADVVTGWVYADLLLDCIVWTSSVIVEKAEIEKAGLFDESLRKGQDYDLWLRLSWQIEMLGLEQPTALYRTHPDNITNAVKEINYEYLILTRALARWGEAGPDRRTPPAGSVSARLAKSCFLYGLRHYLKGDPRIAVRAFVESMKHSGVRTKSLLYLGAALTKCLMQPLMHR